MIRRRGERAALCVLLGYLLGLRRKELAGLRWDQVVDTEDGPVAMLRTTKGDRPRSVPLSPDAVAVLERIRALPYRYKRRIRDGFVAGVGMGAISDWVHLAGMEAGIPPSKSHTHILRASAATHMLRSGTNVAVVQKLLGHAKLENHDAVPGGH